MRTSPDECVLAFDFSLDTLDMALMAPDGDWIIPHRAYDNNMPGFQQLKQDLLPHLSDLDEVRLTAAGESTALFWWHAFYQIYTDPDLALYTPALALLNPLYVKNFRRAQPEEDKIDPKDARLVGTYYRTMGVKHYHTFDPRYLPLRQLSRAYFRLTHTLAANKSCALDLVYLLASDYRRLKPFSDPFGVTSAHIRTDAHENHLSFQVLQDLPHLLFVLFGRTVGPQRSPQSGPLVPVRALHEVHIHMSTLTVSRAHTDLF